MLLSFLPKGPRQRCLSGNPISPAVGGRTLLLSAAAALILTLFTSQALLLAVEKQLGSEEAAAVTQEQRSSFAQVLAAAQARQEVRVFLMLIRLMVRRNSRPPLRKQLAGWH